MHSDARRAPIFQNFLQEDPQTARQSSRLLSFSVAGAILAPLESSIAPSKFWTSLHLERQCGTRKYRRSNEKTILPEGHHSGAGKKEACFLNACVHRRIERLCGG